MLLLFTVLTAMLFMCYCMHASLALLGCVCVVTYITTVCSTTFHLNADVAVNCDFVDFLETVPD